MPIYEYQCQECGEVRELMQRVDDPPPAACSTCGGAVKKLISAPAFRFKGSGWYVTDYARKGSGKETGTASSGKAEEGTGGKSESKSQSAEKSSSDAGGKASGKAAASGSG